MSTLQKKQKNNKQNEIMSFTFPRLVTGKEWYIIFYAFDPAKDAMRRKRIKLNHIEKITERRQYAAGRIKQIFKELDQGWNPWIEDQNEKAFRKFEDVCQQYRIYIDKLQADGILRPDTHRDYTSQLRNIETWNKEKNKNSITYIYQFNKSFISDLLEEMYIGRGNSAVTRNNYLTFVRIFCTFLLEKQYLHTNPSEGISFLRKSKIKKIRTVIEEKDIIKLCNYLEKNNKHFLLASYILHYCFVRPKEMSYIQLKHFDLKKQTLYIPGDVSKNGNSATVTLPTKIIHLMLDLEVFKHPSSYYLFGDKFKPNAEHKYSKQFTDFWSKTIRKELNFPDTYQFYSLKDTGITEMLRKYDPLTVRDQARHSSIEMTNKYTPQGVDRANPLIVQHEGVF